VVRNAPLWGTGGGLGRGRFELLSVRHKVKVQVYNESLKVCPPEPQGEDGGRGLVKGRYAFPSPSVYRN